MAKRIILGAVIAAIAMFFWGAFYWMVLPNVFDISVTLPTAAQTSVTDALKPHLKDSGVYFVPSPVEGEDKADDPNSPWMKRHQQGPVAQIFYQAAGVDPMAGSTLGLGFIHTLLCTLFVATLLALLKKSFCCFWARWAFVIGMGLFVGVWGELRQVIWMYHSFGYEFFNACYDVSTWTIGGAILAAIVKCPARVAKDPS